MNRTIRCLQVERTETKADLAEHGIRTSADEIAEVAERLGRDPTIAEVFLIDVAYSEHCSYKSSRRFLRDALPPLAPHVRIGPGEDAGVIDIGTWNGVAYALVVAHESHNHPSQLLPIEGAATGVGGIVRDVYCMGADVIGVLDGLRFGDLEGPNGDTTGAVARGVVRGIWEYGNALGVPNLGGDLSFDRCYDDNCLVNVVALGIVPVERILRSRVPEQARVEPYDLILVGKPTDRSGLGGASFASQILDAESADQNLGAVQIHDPFLKRVLVEATKKVWDLLAEKGISSGFKDLGAGGFGGASSELVVAGGFGARIDLDRLPAADRSIPPEHLLVGETQERFVWALPRRITAEVLRIYNEDFDLPGVYPGACAQVVGEVTEEDRYEVSSKGETIVSLPFSILKETPVLERPTRPRSIATDPGSLPEPEDWNALALELLADPALCSRAHVYRHYDSEVRGEALLRPGEADAGLCRPLPGTTLGIAVSLDGNGRWCDLDPYHGTVATVLESVRNVVAVGARPRALTDCMNFGSPEEPECLWEFEQSMRGMHDACVGLGLPEGGREALPIVSGNVSFYNQSASGQRIDPTPVIACFGTIDDWRRALRPRLRRQRNSIVYVGRLARAWGSSPALKWLGGAGTPPRPDLTFERQQIWGVLQLIESGGIVSCHDVGEGGLFASLAESLVHEEGPTGLGADLDLGAMELSPTELLLTEEGGFLLEIDEARIEEVARRMREKAIVSYTIGHVTDSGRLVVREGTRTVLDSAVADLWKAWSGRLGPWIEGVES